MIMEKKPVFYTYILQSASSGRLYIGQTTDMVRRLQEHEEGITPSTRKRGPWELIYCCESETRQGAVALERRLKGWKNRQKVLEWIARQNSH